MVAREPYFAETAALMGDPGRANILAALMDGRARTAKELALIAGVSPQTTSGHLNKLSAGALVECLAQGRYRYYRIANPLVACAIEGLMALSHQRPKLRPARPMPESELRVARTCYDHLAGRLGVELLAQLLKQGHIKPGEPDYRLSKRGAEFLATLGLDAEKIAAQRRGFARPCLDWSERRPHLAGALGAAIADRCFELGWIDRMRDTRAVKITPKGASALRSKFGVTIAPAKER